MRAGLIVAAVLVMLIAFFLNITFIGMILGIPLGLIGFIMLLIGLFTSGSKTVIVNPQQTQHIVINRPVKANRYCS